MTQFTLIKTGQIDLTASHPKQCKEQGHGKFNYTVTVCCGDKLDGDGFIIDNTEIAKAVKVAAKPQSCEIMAKRITEKVHMLLIRHGAHINKIRTEIVPVIRKPTTFITYEESY